MTKLVKIHPDILIALNEINDEYFKTTTIRKYLMKLSKNYNNLNTVRMFAYRHLTDLVELGVLSCCDKKRNKNYKKTDKFHSVKFNIQLSSKKQDKKKITLLKYDGKKNISEICVNDLIKQKNTMESELSIKLAEMEQYKVMMEQFPETASLALKLYSEIKENIALITGKIRAINNVLSYQKIDI